MAIQIRSFFQLAFFSLFGLLFYYANLFIGDLGNPFLYKSIAVVFLLLTFPLPVLAIHRKDLFKGMQRSVHQLVVLGSMALLVHHFLLTFIIVFFTGEPVQL